MYSVVNEYEGTAYSSRIAGKHKFVGKTGTSQVKNFKKERVGCFKK